jgi:3-oxoacyl-[acyl-carrier protein] reductase
MGKLSGKVAVVTGASKGIGAAIAEDLAANGASVVVNYASSKSGADAVVEKITKAGGKAIAVGGSVAEPEQIKKLIDETVKAYGKIDILVNNAGIFDFGPLETITPEHFHSQFNINVLGLLLTTQAAVPHFPAEGGSIINISSVVATLAPAGGSVYSATKGAVDTITLSLSKELGPKKIRVNSLSPGMVVTEGAVSKGFIGSPFEAKAVEETPLGRVGQPNDIATAVTFAASDDAGWVTGQIIKVSGGAR